MPASGGFQHQHAPRTQVGDHRSRESGKGLFPSAPRVLSAQRARLNFRSPPPPSVIPPPCLFKNQSVPANENFRVGTLGQGYFRSADPFVATSELSLSLVTSGVKPESRQGRRETARGRQRARGIYVPTRRQGAHWATLDSCPAHGFVFSVCQSGS